MVDLAHAELRSKRCFDCVRDELPKSRSFVTWSRSVTAPGESMMTHEPEWQPQSLQIVRCSKQSSTLLVAVVVVHQDLGAI